MSHSPAKLMLSCQDLLVCGMPRLIPESLWEPAAAVETIFLISVGFMLLKHWNWEVVKQSS